MGLEVSDVNDGAILGATMREETGKGVVLKIILPSGRELTSEAINPEMLTTSVMLSWCENVREQVAFDSNEKELEARRKRQLELPIQSPAAPASFVAPATVPSVSDPLEWAKCQRDLAVADVEKLQASLENITSALREAVARRAKWSTILAHLAPVAETEFPPIYKLGDEL